MQNNCNTTDRKIKLNLTKLLGIRAVRTAPGGYRPVSIMNRASLRSATSIESIRDVPM